MSVRLKVLIFHSQFQLEFSVWYPAQLGLL